LENTVDDTVLFNRPTSSYGNIIVGSIAGQTTHEIIPIYSKEHGDQTYRFTIEDSNGDGLCCSHGYGSYELHIGDFVEGQPLLSGSIFNSKEVWLIEVTSSSSPTATLQPQDDDIYATLQIQFDQYPEDVGIRLENTVDDTVLFNRPTSYYENSLAGQTIYERIPIYSKERGDQTYRFTIEDSYGDGLCCSVGDGSYELYIGDVADGQPLLSGSSFNYNEVWLIEVTSSSSPSARSLWCILGYCF